MINPRLVRGLDYYSETVFEWVTDQLGAQGTVCAGGRYDGLVEQMGDVRRPVGLPWASTFDFDAGNFRASTRRTVASGRCLFLCLARPGAGINLGRAVA